MSDTGNDVSYDREDLATNNANPTNKKNYSWDSRYSWRDFSDTQFTKSVTGKVEIQNILQDRLIDRLINDSAAAGVSGLVVHVVKGGDDNDRYLV